MPSPADQSEQDLRGSRLPAGWTPLELLKHLAGVERRWFRWGFMGEQVDVPWVEEDPEGAVLGEYARHAGHLDVVRELADSVTGE